ncbi:MAG: glycosyltransferase family 1 protein [Patescibacteria group bacterium]
MKSKVIVYDPTSSDKLSKVRGIGRYLQILKENFSNEFEFVNNETMKQLNNDCVFVNPFYNFLQRPLTLKRIASKQIAVIHDLIPLKYPSHFPAGIKGSIYILLNKFALKNYDLLITDSEASKRDIIKILGIKENKIKVIYPCLPKEFTKSQNSKEVLSFPRRRESRLKSPYKNEITDWIPSYEGMTLPNFCLYVGDATWNKNLVNLARAIKIANVNCVFVGKVFNRMEKVASEEVLREADCRDNRQSLAEEESRERLDLLNPWQSELKEFLKMTKNDKRFIFAGFVPDSKLIKLYQQATFNILPSRDEGFGFSYLEAANFSCPSLLSDIPVLREISDNQALFAYPKNPQNIADKIRKIYTDENLRNKIGADAKKGSEFFSAEKFKKEFLSVI